MLPKVKGGQVLPLGSVKFTNHKYFLGQRQLSLCTEHPQTITQLSLKEKQKKPCHSILLVFEL